MLKKSISPFYRPVHKHILALSAPSMIALISEPLLGLIDTLLVSRYQLKSLAAMAVVTGLLSSIIWLFNFFSAGTTANIAFFHGRKDINSQKTFFIQSQMLAWIIGFILIIILFWSEDLLLSLMGAVSDVKQLGHSYYIIRLAGIPFIFSYFVSLGFLRGLSEMKTPMIIIASVNILNGILDYILIYGVGPFPEMGLKGAATATVAAQIISAILFFIAVFRKMGIEFFTQTPFSFSWSMFNHIFSVNKHLFFRTFFLLTAMTVATAIASRMGIYILGAHQIGMQIWLFCSFAIDAFAVTGQALAGKAKGCGAKSQLRLNIIFLEMWGLALGIMFAILFAIFKHPLTLSFTKDPRLIEQIYLIFPFIIAFQPFNGLTFVMDGILIGVLDTAYLMKSLFIASIIIYIPVAFFSYLMNWGITGIWWGLTFFLLTRLLFNSFRLHLKQKTH